MSNFYITSYLLLASFLPSPSFSSDERADKALSPPQAIVNIPDANFKAGLINLGVDTNSDGEIQYSEAESFTGQINLAGSGISNLTGIEAFTNLTDLRVHYNSLTSLNLSGNVKLKLLHVQNNNLASVNLSANSELDMLRIQNNNLTALDVSANTKLRYLEANNNDLTYLNAQNGNNTMMYKFAVTGNPDLECVQVDDVSYAQANFDEGVDAAVSFSLDCGEAQEPEIISFTPTLSATSSTDLPLPPSTPDKTLNLVTDAGYPTYKWYKNGALIATNSSNTLTLNNASGTLFEPADAGSYTVKAADAEGNESLISNTITVTYTPPQDFVYIPDANFKAGLINLGVDTNSDGEIQYSEAESFTGQINLAGSGISNLTGIEAFTNLTDLRVHYNSLTSLDLGNNPNLKQLHVQNNELISINLSANPELNMLRVQNNDLAALNLSQNGKLKYLEASDNQLISLNIQNGNNHNVYKLDLLGNPDLSCIQVDNPAYAQSNLSDEVPPTASFQLACGDAPDIINVKPGITATSPTSLPLPESTPDKSLDLITDPGYHGYRWFKNGALLLESASNILTLNNASGTLFSPADAGDYTVILVDEEGYMSLVSDPVSITYTDPNGPAPFPTEFQKVELVTEIKNPVNFEFAPDGRAFILDRHGEVLIYNPTTQTTVSAGVINVFHGLEDGLLGIQFDPDFATNNQIYLHYSPKSESVNRVSRFTMNGNQLVLSSEELIIQWPTQRQKCCHAAGDMDMDSAGNLYIATGDNTNHSKFSTLNETDPNESSENTSSNTNDLRGKILRIKPEPGGGYSIPEGNLFPNGVGGLPEIYVMGARNPFKIFIDKENEDWLFWGEVGPDANNPGPEGPEGLDEINLTKSAGNYGWPYFSGKNEPYLNTYANPNFYYDPDNPVNISVWNTGATDLPPAQPSWMEFFHECYLAGPRYYYDPSINNPKKFPASLDKYFFYYDFNTSKVWAAELDQDGDIIATHQMNPEVFNGAGFIDLKIGPDGQMYILEYGAGCCPNNTGTGKLIRIDYTGEDSNNAPVVSISADQTAGSLPLLVNFSSEGTSDPDGDPLTYEWDFQSDGTIDSNEENPSFTYTSAGSYDAQLRVSDGNGGTSSKSLKIHAGNHAATFVFNHPPDGGLFNWEDHLNYDIEVNDVEDGSTSDGTIDCSDVNIIPSIGHLDHFHDDLPINQCTGTFPFTITGMTRKDKWTFITSSTLIIPMKPGLLPSIRSHCTQRSKKQSTTTNSPIPK